MVSCRVCGFINGKKLHHRQICAGTEVLQKETSGQLEGFYFITPPKEPMVIFLSKWTLMGNAFRCCQDRAQETASVCADLSGWDLLLFRSAESLFASVELWQARNLAWLWLFYPGAFSYEMGDHSKAVTDSSFPRCSSMEISELELTVLKVVAFKDELQKD